MDLFLKILSFFQTSDKLTQATIIWGAAVGVVASIRTLLALIAPLTDTKLDDKALGIFTKIYDLGSKLTNHKG